jgi:hypothetical protein
MRKLRQGGMLALALALGFPVFVSARSAVAKTARATASNGDESANGQTLSKEDQEKLREHNKLRAEIKRVKYPAAKSTIVSHVHGIKADDKKWFEQTLPDKTYSSADDVYSALGWATTPAPEAK